MVSNRFLGTDYAFACETEWSSYRDLEYLHRCTLIKTTYTVTALLPYKLLYSASVSTACGSSLYGERTPVVTDYCILGALPGIL